MEFTIQWFWLIKLAMTLITAYIMYQAVIVHKFKIKLLNVLAIVVLILTIVSPVKMNPQTPVMNTKMNHQIQQSKILPPKVIDNSFENSQKLNGITEKDLQ